MPPLLSHLTFNNTMALSLNILGQYSLIMRCFVIVIIANGLAVLMNIEAHKIGLNAMEKIWVLNVKNKPEEIGSLRMIKGVYPAYHMNKEHWLSLNLTEIDDTLFYELIDESFSLTFKK